MFQILAVNDVMKNQGLSKSFSNIKTDMALYSNVQGLHTIVFKFIHLA